MKDISTEIKVVTKYNKDLIVQHIEDFRSLDNLVREITRLRDEGVKKALKELGYLSPEDLKSQAFEIACSECSC